MEPKRPKKLSKLACGAVALLVGLILVPVQITTAAGPQEVDIQVSTDGIIMDFHAYSERELLTFNVRIVGPERFIFERRVQDATVQWIPPQHLSDGSYNWEAWIVTADPTASMRELTPELQKRPPDHWFDPEVKQTHVASGSFQVKHGVIEEAPSREPGGSISRVHRVAGFLLDLLVPSAQAQNFSDNVVITKSVPEIRYQHTGTGARNWSTGFNPLAGWYVRDLTANTIPFVVQPAAPTSSLVIRQDGTVSLPGGAWDTAGSEGDFRIGSTDYRMKIGVATGGGGAGNATIAAQGGTNTLFLGSGSTVAQHRLVAIRGNLGRVGIGTTDPQNLLHLHKSDGNQIRLSDSSTTVRVEGFANSFRIMDGSSLTTRYGFDVQAPPSTIRTTATGSVGFGTAAPAAPVHVWRSNGSAQVLVEETSSGDSTLFELSNNGHSRFIFRDTSTSNLWEFRTAGSGNFERFQINRLGSGELEFQVRRGGDAFFAGDVTANGVLLTSTREAKTDFAPLDVNDVLDRLSSLEISKWRYKHEDEGTVHFGPVAEEFHEIFGLSDGKHLNMIDTNGITFAAIQALEQRNKQLNQENQQIKAENQSLAQRLERIENELKLF